VAKDQDLFTTLARSVLRKDATGPVVRSQLDI
jgi:hypothetical protein